MKFIRYIFFTLNLVTVAHAANTDPLKDYTAGLAEYDKKEYEKAGELLKKFVKEQPYEFEVREAWFRLAEVSRMMKRYNEAIATYNIVLHRYPSGIRTKIIHLRSGEMHYKIGAHNRAENLLKEYLKTEKDNKTMHRRAYTILAKLYDDNRRFSVAVEMYNKALLLPQEKEEAPFLTEAEIHSRTGTILLNELDKPDLAFDHIKKAISKGHQNSVNLKALLRKITLRHLDTENGLPDDAVADIKTDGDDIWVATWGGGVVRFSRSFGNFKRIKLPSAQTRSIHIDHDAVYIATYDGIFVFDKKSERISNLTAEKSLGSLAQKVLKDDRHLYFTTLSKGVIKYDLIRKNTEMLASESFVKTAQVYSLDADLKHVVFGTLEKGVVLLNKESGQTEYINRQNGQLKRNNVKAVLLDGRYLWIGVHNDGVYRYDTELKTIKRFDWSIPFPSVITKREKEIWIGTSGQGIRIFNQETETLESLRSIEGLYSNEIHHIQVEGDYIWIGYLDNGIDVFYRPTGS
jgi:tetratricopeptide (TPR) repeat protein